MNKIILALALLGGSASALLQPRETYEAAFYTHMKTYDLKFADGAEFVKRLDIFAAKSDEITVHNQGNFTYTMGHNEYSHLTWAEFAEMFHLGKPVEQKRTGTNPMHTAADRKDRKAAAASVDWEAAGKVTPVKNQGSCGSCWSFSTTGSLEGAYALKNDWDVSNWTGFSEQMLVSCDNTDAGCDGGLMDSAFAWVEGYGGLCAEADYAYTSGDTTVNGVCDDSACTVVEGSAPSGYTDVESGSVAAMESAVAQQPVSIAIQANQKAFQSYSGGVLTGRCGTSLDHGVLAVGYGTLDGVDYWKVKNSWGASWGLDGYILIEKSSSDECGVLLMASYPTM